MSSTSSYWMRTSIGFNINESRWSTVLWYGKWAYSERNDIHVNTEHLFFCITENNEKRKEKKKLIYISPHPESIAVQMNSRHGQYHCAMTTLIGSFSKPRRRRRRRRERRQTEGLMSKTVAMHVRFESLYISLPSSAKQQREMTKFYVFWRTRTAMANFWYLL